MLRPATSPTPSAVLPVPRRGQELRRGLRQGASLILLHDHPSFDFPARAAAVRIAPDPSAPCAWPVLGRQRLAPGAIVPRNLAVGGSAMLVLGGGIVQSGFGGRARLERGMLAIRPWFDCRAARASPAGADLLHLPWRFDGSLGGVYDGIDVDRLACAARADPSAACAAIEALVAAAFAADTTLGISGWSARAGLSRKAVARDFRRAYGVAPARFRLEIRARAAWVRIVSGAEPLSQIALETGFADQAHMTRTLGWLTGRPPIAWRRARIG